MPANEGVASSGINATLLFVPACREATEINRAQKPPIYIPGFW
jgi:hypothetical protein